MSKPEHTIHIHIGVDHVMESVLAKMFRSNIVEAGQERIKYIGDDFYKAYLSDAIDSGTQLYMGDILSRANLASSSLVVSRPRFLFTGSPLNGPAAATKSLYKMDGIQLAFTGFKKVFHVFLIDHLTYLDYHRNKNIEPDFAENCSWLPLIQGIKSKLHHDSELRVWDAENETLHLQRIMLDVLSLPKGVSRRLTRQLQRNVYNPRSWKEAESDAWSRGLNVYQLDDAYERDRRFVFDC